MDATRLWLWPDAGRAIGRRVSLRTHRWRRSLVKHVVASIGDVRLAFVTPRHFLRLQNDCAGLFGLDPQTVNAVTHNVFLGLMHDLDREEMIPREVYLGLLRLPKLRVDRRRSWHILDEQERDHAIAWFHRHTDAGPLVSTLFLTACRIGEAAGLMDSDVCLTLKSIRFERSREGGLVTPSKTEQAQRSVVMPDRLIAELAPAMGRGEAYLFPGFRCAVLNIASFRHNVWYPGLERAGLPRLRIHDTRHCWTSIALRSGIPLAEVAAQLGDTLAVTEAVYAHLLPTRRANEAIGEKPPPDSSPPTAVEIVRERKRPALHLVLGGK